MLPRGVMPLLMVTRGHLAPEPTHVAAWLPPAHSLHPDGLPDAHNASQRATQPLLPLTWALRLGHGAPRGGDTVGHLSHPKTVWFRWPLQKEGAGSLGAPLYLSLLTLRDHHWLPKGAA